MKKNTSSSRRKILKAAGVGGIALTAYSLHRGLRFPPLSWEPAALSNEFHHKQLSASVVDLIEMPSEQPLYSFRAYAPEPKITLLPKENQQIQLSINNIATDASLVVAEGDTNKITETVNGITRLLTIDLASASKVTLKWQLPPLKEYTFASIGDTGGDKELAWSIERAHALGARFLLHLGDFNYQEGDYERSIELFHNAPLPCYVSIGNHDFHDSGIVYGPFLDQIGPLNNQFSIGKTRFANIDNAASTFPYGSGHRGDLLAQMIANKDQFNDTVAFAHRPLFDPRPGETHDMGSENERDWLIESLKLSNTKTLLSGHIHIYHRDTFHGIDNIIAGQGLGHSDLITGKDESKMVIGQVNQDGVVHYETVPLALPMMMHCHPRTNDFKDSLLDSPTGELIKELYAACKTTS